MSPGRTQVLIFADALTGGQLIPSFGGSGFISDLRWDGRSPNIEENPYRRRWYQRNEA